MLVPAFSPQKSTVLFLLNRELSGYRVGWGDELLLPNLSCLVRETLALLFHAFVFGVSDHLFSLTSLISYRSVG